MSYVLIIAYYNKDIYINYVHTCSIKIRILLLLLLLLSLIMMECKICCYVSYCDVFFFHTIFKFILTDNIGTIRSNLDPFKKYSDMVLWEALKRTELSKTVKSLEDTVAENGSNFSVGERQLLCIARY